MAISMLFSFVKVRPRNKFSPAAFAVVAFLLLLETIWLLPFLDARATLVISGETPPPSYLHLIYIAFDAVKLALLLTLGVSAAKNHLRFE